MHLSTHTWMRPEPLEVTLRRAASLGYTSIEIAGEPDRYAIDETKALLKKYNIACWGAVTIMYGSRNLAAADKAEREDTINYMKKVVDLSAGLGGEIITLVPGTVGKLQPSASSQEEWTWVVQGVREVALYAAEKGIRVAVEPLNRFETYLVMNTSQALQVIEEVNLPNVGVAFDPFHLNIEEPDLFAAIRRCGDKIFDVHLGDNNRLACGDGTIDWPKFIKTLREVGYKGGLAHESMPPVDRTSRGAFGSKQLEEEPWDVDAGTLQFLKDHASGVLRENYYHGLLAKTAETILPLIK
ncbi:xylose isomerase-like protein [Hypoxylon trugodes]|uniref:xylose isomerase-like protein n=1 Tax=Hypoxylon trugodes TaxID=326681 RepID=UPI00218DC0FA|nr:xylose isomerase-like protein [Hypoxylon trugodes]KAI1385001.1 xylose isomerase-like protein [Hypoxylon trugodes]